jgi:hypothetical protein
VGNSIRQYLARPVWQPEPKRRLLKKISEARRVNYKDESGILKAELSFHNSFFPKPMRLFQQPAEDKA